MGITDQILETIGDMTQLLPRPLETKHAWVKRLRKLDRKQFERGVRQLADRGLIKVLAENDRKFMVLTNAGQLELLLQRAAHPNIEKWDGMWRLVIFDIPESSKEKRHLFRTLLKQNGFYMLQASVYVNPYPLNKEALAYLQKTGLIRFIRILRVDTMDNDSDLKKHFNLAEK
jgi:DNA-binding transcriptional regulator PaaX